MNAKSTRKPNSAVARLTAGIRPVLVTAVVLIPLCISPAGADMFRLPKDLLLRASVILMAAFLLDSIIRNSETRLRIVRLAESRWIAVIIGWVLLSALVATNRFVAIGGLMNTVVACLFFLSAFIVFQSSSWRTLIPVLVPASVNAALALMQGVAHVAPWPLAPSPPTGLLGNGNDLGASLVAPLMVALAAMVISRGGTRLLSLGCAILLGIGLVASATLTAIIAAAAGMFALAALAIRRHQRLVLAVCVLLALCLIVYRPLTQRAVNSISWLASGKYDRVLTFRLTPFLAAWNMAWHHPILGVGPACFGPNYFDWKVTLERRFPRLLHHPLEEQQNFGEAHNDHLQTMAEVGFPGYALFLLCLFVIGRISWQITLDATVTREERMARLLAFPLVLSFAILALAQFPLHLPAPLVAYLYCAAACRAWASRTRAEPVAAAGG